MDALFHTMNRMQLQSGAQGQQAAPQAPAIPHVPGVSHHMQRYWQLIVTCHAELEAMRYRPLTIEQQNTMLYHLLVMHSGVTMPSMETARDHAYAMLLSFRTSTPLPPMPQPITVTQAMRRQDMDTGADDDADRHRPSSREIMMDIKKTCIASGHPEKYDLIHSLLCEASVYKAPNKPVNVDDLVTTMQQAL